MVKNMFSECIELENREAAVDYFYQQGWTDGLPIVPPTPEKVEKMLDYVRFKGNEILGVIPERQREVTTLKVAINAVMAGCLPSYMPIVVSAVQAILEPSFGIHGVTSTTGGAGILIVVNGPIIEELSMNTSKNFLGSSTNRANATIGRAIRLLILNVGGGNLFDQATMGHPGKITFCVAEAKNEIWEPLHVQRGFNKDSNTVTVFAIEGPNQVNNHISKTPEGILMTIVDRMSAVGRLHMQRPIPQTPCVVVICPEHQATLIEHGWSKEKVVSFLFEHTHRSEMDLYHFGQRNDMPLDTEANNWVPIVPSKEHIYVLSGGGIAGRFSAIIPAWGNIKQSRAITKAIVKSGFT